MRRLLVWAVSCEDQETVWGYGEYLNSLERLARDRSGSNRDVRSGERLRHGADELGEEPTD